MRRRLLVGLLSAVLTTLAWSVVRDIQARSAPPDVRTWRLSRPAAWAQSSYWSPAFAVAEMAIPWTFDRGYALPADYTSAWYNFHDGRRRTVGQPDGATNTIYLIGDSSIYDVAVPDEWTIASQLQALTPTYRVENLGMASATIPQFAMRLKTLALHPGDWVVFYGGAADVNALAYGKATRVQILDGIRVALDTARRNAADHGARFALFLQPHLWSKAPSVYERAILANPLFAPPDLVNALQTLWPDFQALPGVVDLTHRLDALRSSGVEVYIDGFHVNERADGVLARAIYDVLFPVL